MVFNERCPSFKNGDTDFSKGFIQRIILISVSQPNNSSIPKRYIQALSNQTQNLNISNPPQASDKSGGVVIMHKQRYVDKINSLLEDTNTYEIPNLITINKNIISFNKLFKNRKKKQNLGCPSLNTTLQSPHYMTYPKSTNQTTPMTHYFQHW